MSDRDYYEIMGLMPGADGAMVDQAYWHLARKYQALATTNPRAHQMLDDLNEAYGVLGTPRLRSQYDGFRDDVLLTKGMAQPMVSKQPRQKRRKARRPAAGAGTEGRDAGGGSETERRPRGPGNRPSLHPAELPLEHWRTFAVGGVIMALTLAAAWQGASLVFVIPALVAGLGLALSPALKRAIPDISIDLPAVTMPDIKAPTLQVPKLGEVNMAALRELGVGLQRDESMDPGELRDSTAAMIARWRKSVGLRPMAVVPADGAPSNTLVDIVETERALEADSAPLNAVIDILRHSSRNPESV